MSLNHRAIQLGERVAVYWNLHKHCFSIKALSGPDKGLVIGHAGRVWLTDATLEVNETGRQRVLREQSKNVHAFIKGYWSCKAEFRGADYHRPEIVTYNPYRDTSFVLESDKSQARTTAHIAYGYTRPTTQRPAIIIYNPYSTGDHS